jgi:hypothetical protein
MTPLTFFISIGAAILTGFVLSWMCYFRTRSSKSFLTASALMPAAVAIVIAIVNGNLGAGIAIAAIGEAKKAAAAMHLYLGGAKPAFEETSEYDLYSVKNPTDEQIREANAHRPIEARLAHLSDS